MPHTRMIVRAKVSVHKGKLNLIVPECLQEPPKCKHKKVGGKAAWKPYGSVNWCYLCGAIRWMEWASDRYRYRYPELTSKEKD